MPRGKSSSFANFFRRVSPPYSKGANHHRSQSGPAVFGRRRSDLDALKSGCTIQVMRAKEKWYDILTRYVNGIQKGKIDPEDESVVLEVPIVACLWGHPKGQQEGVTPGWKFEMGCSTYDERMRETGGVVNREDRDDIGPKDEELDQIDKKVKKSLSWRSGLHGSGFWVVKEKPDRSPGWRGIFRRPFRRQTLT